MMKSSVFCRLLYPLLAVLISIAIASPSSATTPDGDNSITIDLAKPHDNWLAAGASGPLAPTVSSGPTQIAPGNVGWFDYDFSVDREGWYRVLVDASSHISRTEFIFDPAKPESEAHLIGGKPVGNGRFDAGWAWLTAGTHRLRIQQFFWTGFPQISHLRLEAPPQDQSFVFRVEPQKKKVFVTGKCTPLTIETGGNATAFTISATFRSGGKLIAERQITIPSSQTSTEHSLDQPCDLAGDISLDLRSLDEQPSLNANAHVNYTVFDTSPVEPIFKRGRLAIDIDAVGRQPDFRANDTSVTSGPAGMYRSSGDHGTTPYVRHSAVLPFGSRPDWFAYQIEGLHPNHPYILEVEYPDDAPRVFVVALRDSRGEGYPTSIGAETGVVWPLSGHMVKMSAVFWPSSSDGRAIVFNIHNGMKAAVSHIRIYEAISTDTNHMSPAVKGRDVAFYYEEGDNFRDIVGEGYEPDAVFAPVDRYLRLARSSGATVVSPTAVVYNFVMYPSRFHLAFGDQDRDMMAAFMLGAERYGLKIMPQLAPRADEVIWPPRDQASLEKRLLLSGNGQHHFLRPDGDIFRPPFYNPLNPDVRNWYVDMIGELADRYKDYPAFAGIDLRVSDWQNPALNNLVSLDWGYEAGTVARFFHETKLPLPANLDISTDTPEAARRRHDYLVNKNRAAWIAWRCEKIRDLYRDIVLRIRAARPDLRLSVSIFGERTWSPETMRELGIDIKQLEAIDGLTIIDERFGHGAREASPAWRRTQRDDLMSKENLESLAAPHSRPHILFPMEYIEITGKVAPSAAIGLPPPSKEPWISSTTEPPGRLALARFATSVGLSDPFLLGDGGNGYVFGDESLREFMDEFRSLPRLPFERVLGLPDTIAVWQRDQTFYVVNMLNVPVSANLKLDAPGSVKRATSGQIITASNGILKIALQPYQMEVFETEAGRHVLGTEIFLDKSAELGFAARVTAEKQSTAAICGAIIADKECTETRTRLRETEAAIAHGNYWTAERLLEAGE